MSIATGTAIAGVCAGLVFAASPKHVRVAIPLSAGLLMGVALFGLLPELAHDLSWTLSVGMFAAGFGLLSVLDRMGIPICPDCSHDHDHGHCGVPLHGFATPLLIAAGVHSLFDGWALAAVGSSGSAGMQIALPLALVLHKLPEGLALGGILKPALRSPWAAAGLAMCAEVLTLAGGGISMRFAPGVGSVWTSYPLALAGGFFLFLAYHALHGEWRKRPRRALLTGLAGLVFSALLQTGLRSYFG